MSLEGLALSAGLLSLWNDTTLKQRLCRSVDKSCLTLRPHGLQHARLLCSLLSPRVYSNLCPLSQWCYWTILSSAVPFSFGLLSFPESGSFPVSQLFASSGQYIGALASVLPMNIQSWFPLGLIGLIFLLSKGLSRASPGPKSTCKILYLCLGIFLENLILLPWCYHCCLLHTYIQADGETASYLMETQTI